MAYPNKPRIALVEASSPLTHVYSRTYLPRLGIPTLGAILKKLGYDCDIWFQAMKGFNEDNLKNYDIVGIGSLSGQIHEAYRLADSLRRIGKTVVMGGPHVTFMTEEAIEHCDYIVIGEGEISFPALIEALSTGETPDNIAGLVYRKPGGEVHHTEASSKKVDFAGLPSPDFSLSPQVTAGKMPPIVSASRGCPHNCTFCSVTAVFGRQYRFKTNEQIISELPPILDRSVFFADDNFCANPAWTKSLLREMIAKDVIPLRWAAQMTVGAAADTELLDLMQQTKCRIVYVGIESVIPSTLKSFGKVHKLDSISRCIENLHERNIGIHGMFVVGIDDDVEVVEKIIDFSIEHDIDTIQLFALTPFPGTLAYEKYKDKLLHRDWKYFSGMYVVFKPEKCSAYELQTAILRGMQRFYSLKRFISSYRRGRRWRLNYRAGAYYIVRKWVKENAGYIERLRTAY